jgi:hypothetical protein
MQNFTVFSVLLSFSVVFIVGDLVLHDYLNLGPNFERVESPVEVATDIEPQPETPDEPVPTAPSTTSSQTTATIVTEELLLSIGIADPVLKEVAYPGTVFQSIDFADQKDSDVLERNLFDGENFIGSFYEFHYPTSTGSFQGYLNLRDRAKTLTDLADVEEVNLYGEASFYFNHKQKTKTVHMVMRRGSNVFAFEYPYAQHESMKKLFDLLMVPL